MRTAVISDLHLSALSGEDIVREPGIRTALLERLRGAERIVLLGDLLELRDLPIADALELSRPFFEQLGEVAASSELIIVPGNHDHRLAEPLLERKALSRKPSLGLEHRFRPSGPSSRIAGWLGKTEVSLAYPGIWLRDDVYATHGHYMDCHLTLPRLECLGAAAVMRIIGAPPEQASPDDYERVLRPVYGFTYGLAQSGAPRLRGGAARPSERAWHLVQDSGDRSAGRFGGGKASAAAAGLRGLVWGVNRLLHARFDPDVTPASISRGGIAAAIELAARLRTGAAHLITGHSHRAGPGVDTEWAIPGGGLLHNTGSWIFSAGLCAPGAERSAFWPGTVTWLGDEDPPVREELLRDRSVAELEAIVARQASALR